jgi:hypothetical protein
MNSLVNRPTNDDRIYYNIVIQSDNTQKFGTPAVYNERFLTSMIDKCSDYYLTLVRINVPTSLIPLFVCPITANQGNINLTPFIVTLSYNSNNYSTNVLYVSQNGYLAPTSVGTSSQYYYIYSAQQFINMLNTALVTSFTTLKAANPGCTQTEAPYYLFDQTTQLISLVCQYSYISTSLNTINVSFNSLLYKYIGSAFNTSTNNNNASNSVLDYTYIIQDTTFNWFTKLNVAMTNPPPYLRISQLFQCMFNWTDLNSILLITSQVPLASEHIQPPSSNGQTITVQNNSLQIITDLTPDFVDLSDANSLFQYAVEGSYRILNFQSDQPLEGFDVKLYWTDRFINMYPILIPVGFNVNMKFCFIKRNTFFS